VFVVAAVIVIVTAVPAIGPPGMVRGGGTPGGWPDWSATLARSCLGGATGWLAGGITRSPGDAAGFAAVGAAAGWQAGVVVAVLTTIARWLVAVAPMPQRLSQVVAVAAPAAVATLLFATWAAFAGAWGGFWRNLTGG